MVPIYNHGGKHSKVRCVTNYVTNVITMRGHGAAAIAALLPH